MWLGEGGACCEGAAARTRFLRCMLVFSMSETPIVVAARTFTEVTTSTSAKSRCLTHDTHHRHDHVAAILAVRAPVADVFQHFFFAIAAT